MKKVLLLLVLIAPVFIMLSCTKKNENEYRSDNITKELLIGTWVIKSEIQKYDTIEIVFKDDNDFGLKTIKEWVTEDGGLMHSESETMGFYTMEGNKIIMNYFYFLVERFKTNTLEGKIDLGFGSFHAIAVKQ